MANMKPRNIGLLLCLLVFCGMITQLYGCEYHRALLRAQEAARRNRERYRALNRHRTSARPIHSNHPYHKPAQTGYVSAPLRTSYNVVNRPAAATSRNLQRIYYPTRTGVRNYISSFPSYSKSGLIQCGSSRYHCPENYECVKVGDKYRCDLPSYQARCENGFRPRNGTNECIDVDECEEGTDVCSHDCTNTPGGYSCSCPSGYSIISRGTCGDIDECSQNIKYCRYQCHNTDGGYNCSCPSGYTQNGPNCKDINECRGNPCLEGEECLNTYGGHECYIPKPCDEGHTLSISAGGTRTCTTEYGTNVGNDPISFSFNRFALRNGYTRGSEIAMLNFQNQISHPIIRKGGQFFTVYRSQLNQSTILAATNIIGPNVYDLEFDLYIGNNFGRKNRVAIEFVVSKFNF